MDFWATVGIVSSVLGILSFLKIDALSIVDFLKNKISALMFKYKKNLFLNIQNV
ncbi:hypothetical protein [Bergeyella sp. RCAD1439]|uniref:hypothetical protein n=1 Tax=Bergeyella anatis TaxID=3113737 RepID=UPI002E189D5F|nr:hypothetical protein [Bergeyella sp. RCAD1439]